MLKVIYGMVENFNYLNNMSATSF